MSTESDLDEHFLGLAIEQAEKSFSEVGIPIGAVLIDRERCVLGAGHNERVQRSDAIAHGEMACLREAGRLKSYRDTTLYTTLSPCSMCSGGILLFKIPRVVIGEAKNFAGDIAFLESHGVEVRLMNDPRCIDLMTEFQNKYPEVWREDIGEI